MLPLRLSLLKLLMRMLGFGSLGLLMACTKYGAPEDMAPMDIEGSVVSKDSAKAIPGIKIEVLNSYGNVTSLSDVNGLFSIHADIDVYNQTLLLSIKDIDGSNNRSFQDLDTTLQMTPAEIDAGEKKNIQIQLKKM